MTRKKHPYTGAQTQKITDQSTLKDNKAGSGFGPSHSTTNQGNLSCLSFFISLIQNIHMQERNWMQCPSKADHCRW